MIDYNEHRDDEDFMTILDHLRHHCLDGECEVIDATDIGADTVYKHFRLAQAIVAEEIAAGVEYDPKGAAHARGFMAYLTTT
jgi:hypothetical protein